MGCEIKSRMTKKRLFLSFVNIAVIPVVLAALFSSPASAISEKNEAPPQIRVGSELEFPPYAFIDERGRPAGFSVDLIKNVAGAMGLSITISSGPWDTVWNDLVNGRLDVLPLVAKLPERAKLVDFGLPHTETYDAFFMRMGDQPIENIAAAGGKEIVVMRSDAAHHALLERNFQGVLVLVDTIPEGLSLIASGQHDAFLCSKLIGIMAIKEHGITGLAAGPPIPDYNRVFSFAVSKGNTELLEKLNQGLMIIMTSGEYDRIYEKWLSVDDPWIKLKKYLLPVVVLVIAVALIAGIWMVILQLLVKKRTRELAEANTMLSKSHDELEERVTQRTAELTESNRALQTEITERKNAEARTRHLASFPQLNPSPVIETDASGKITYFNPAIGKILNDLGMNTDDASVFLPGDFDDILLLLNKAWDSTVNREVNIKDRVFSATVHIVPKFNVVRMYAHDITARKNVEAGILRVKEEWERTFNSVPDLIAILDREYRIVRANRAMAEKLGKSADECIGQVCFACVHGSSSPPKICPHTLTMEDGKEHWAELYENRLGGDFLVTTTPLFDETGRMTGSVHVARDITERKEKEAQIRASLEEKELLLREIHHRVKNNMTVIFSMLKLQSKQVKDEQYRRMFQDSMARIKSMALVHEKLYRSGDLAAINFSRYLKDLTNSMFTSYKIRSDRISLKTDVEDISLRIDSAIPCGLIISELVSNAIKHGFPDNRKGEINVALHEINECGPGNLGAENPDSQNQKSAIELVVSDNGAGLPEEIDADSARSLGLTLVQALVKQLHGTIEIVRESGTEFRIRFNK